ncbi:MAG: cbb3-type cytochrome c oxidase N-terminal domain-containing protein [Gemmatirosa sp.]
MANVNPKYDHEEKLLDHSYDGIQEYDNPMPRWWVWTFWATIVFSVLYALNVGRMAGGGAKADYAADMAAFRKAHPAGGPSLDATQLAALAKDPQALALGKATYATNCAACHAADGGGLIGPNLTDRFSLHGSTLPELHKTIAEGVPAKGMPGWAKLLKPDQLNAVVAYVSTLPGTTPARPKEPQGAEAPQGSTTPPIAQGAR